MHQLVSPAVWSLIPESCVNTGRCSGQARPVDQWQRSQSVRRSLRWCLLCYLGDCLSSGGGCELASITRWRVAWGKFIELLSVITFHSFPITSRETVYNSCVRTAMLHASETWAPNLCDLHRLQRNDQAMICWMCGITTAKDHVTLQDLLERMQLHDLAKALRTTDSDGTAM